MSDSDSDVEIIDIERGLELQQNTIENLEKELQIVIANCTYYQQQIQELLAKNTALVKQLEEKEKNNEEQYKQELANQLEDLQKVIEKQSLQIKTYAKQIEETEEEYSILQNKLITTELMNCKYQNQIQELSGEINQVNRKCVQQFNEKLMGENINNLNKIENLSIQVDGLEEKILKLTQQRDHFKKQFFDASSRIISQQQELQQLHNIKQELKNKNDCYQEQYKKLQSVLKDTLDENKKCKLVMGQLQCQIEDYKCKQDLYIREIGKLTSGDKITLKKLQKQNQSILLIKQQEQDKRQLIEQQIKKQQ